LVLQILLFSLLAVQLSPGGDNSNCIKVASWVVGPLANSTCDAAKCGAASAAAGCRTDDRTNITTKLHKVCVCIMWPQHANGLFRKLQLVLEAAAGAGSSSWCWKQQLVLQAAVGAGSSSWHLHAPRIVSWGSSKARHGMACSA
jgi:hypothetical protein